jgi:hypothetical protein
VRCQLPSSGRARSKGRVPAEAISTGSRNDALRYVSGLPSLRSLCPFFSRRLHPAFAPSVCTQRLHPGPPVLRGVFRPALPQHLSSGLPRCVSADPCGTLPGRQMLWPSSGPASVAGAARARCNLERDATCNRPGPGCEAGCTRSEPGHGEGWEPPVHRPWQAGENVGI